LSSATYLGNFDCGLRSQAFSNCPLLDYVCVIDEYPNSTFCGMPVGRNCSISFSSMSSSESSSSSGGKPNPLPANVSPSSSSFIYPSITLLGLVILATYHQMFVF